MCADSGGAPTASPTSNIASTQRPDSVAEQASTSASATRAMELKLSQDDAAKPKQEHFRLLDLPPELVLRVLEHAVVISSRKCPLRIHAFSALFCPCNDFLLGGTDTDSGFQTFWEWSAAVGRENMLRVEHLFVNLVDGGGYAVDPDRLMRAWWLAEMEMFKLYTIEPDQVKMLHVQMNGQKVAILSAIDAEPAFNRYRLSLMDPSEEREGWQKWGAFPENDGELDAKEAERKDW
ncbi:hypothetical protein AC579_9839 [Pseudocercospora musae]|uniref:F-box domain-containing protein n=1 Tax=Pseudocercospora musae TaxID=113226 RepID=A0A139IVF9_9PEZI|nr:hypothetical protein AC579_9839 [Pseudocercospora musae]